MDRDLMFGQAVSALQLALERLNIIPHSNDLNASEIAEKAWEWYLTEKLKPTIKPSPTWLNKPDRAGDWLRYLKHRKQYINLGIFHVDDLTEGLPTDSLWLYIEPPEPPKE